MDSRSSPHKSSSSPELRYPGLDAAALEELVARLAARWAAEAIVAERVDSLGVGIRPAS